MFSPHPNPPFRGMRGYPPSPFMSRGAAPPMMGRSPLSGYPFLGMNPGLGRRSPNVSRMPMGFERSAPFSFGNMPRSSFNPFPPSRRSFSSWPRSSRSSFSSSYMDGGDSDEDDDDDEYDYNPYHSSSFSAQRSSRFGHYRRPTFGGRSRGRNSNKYYGGYDWEDDDEDSDYDSSYSMPTFRRRGY